MITPLQFQLTHMTDDPGTAIAIAQSLIDIKSPNTSDRFAGVAVLGGCGGASEISASST